MPCRSNQNRNCDDEHGQHAGKQHVRSPGRSPVLAEEDDAPERANKRQRLMMKCQQVALCQKRTHTQPHATDNTSLQRPVILQDYRKVVAKTKST